ncbi:hypothetical protein [Terracidiphilus gabretensis]|uniref:hypothetical protein n=1 Tax=Terracidiphilus gabretensis TaxID=1577687 RepID=UPI00071B930A|nr:hypothetical protein [Terracidiphilus gabretensis]
MPPTLRVAERYEGAGLSVTDCAGSQCQASFEVLGRTFHGDAKGDLLIEGETQAIVRLGYKEEEKCTLTLKKTSASVSEINVSLRSGDCSYFETPGASFEHSYALRSKATFWGDDIPRCFVGDSRAAEALCASKTLSEQEHTWGALVWEVADLGEPRLDKSVEEQKILKSCDAASDIGACIGTTFSQSTANLLARKNAWIASVTEPGDSEEAKRAIDAIQGSYEHTFQNGDVSGDKYQSTDTLDIRRISDTSIHFDVHLEFYNGHECNREGTAIYRRAGLFAEQEKGDEGKLCVFEIIPSSKGVQLGDPTGACRLTDCGVRGGYNNAAFSMHEKVKSRSINQSPENSHSSQ